MNVIIATVERIVAQGPHGPYVIASSKGIEGSVTFSLDSDVWHEASYPEEGTLVILSDLRKKRAGWRAMSGRFVRPSDEQKAQSNERKLSMTMSNRLDEILTPIAEYQNQTTFFDGHHNIGGAWNSDPATPTISHAEFVKVETLPRLSEACDRFGIEAVAHDLIDIGVPAYAKLPVDAMACFWDKTIRGLPDGFAHEHEEFRAKNVGKLNPDLAAKFGVKNVFGPILDLGVVHSETEVFDNVNKYFVTHACRMGEVLTRFSYEDYLTYIELAKKLLRSGVYDWSIELHSEQWDQMAPAIDRYGFKAVLEPLVCAMAAMGPIPGAKNFKYGYTFLGCSVRDLLPYMVEKALEEGVQAFEQTLTPIVERVRHFHAQGYLKEGKAWHSKSTRFFMMFKGRLDDIRQHGIESALQDPMSAFV